MKLSSCLICLLLVAAALVTGIPSSAQGHAAGVSLSALTSVPPTIDGMIAPDEWAAGATVSFTIFSGIATLYIMNDATNLYIALRIPDTTLTNRVPQIWFDDNHNGLLEVGEDALFFLGESNPFDLFIQESSSESVNVAVDAPLYRGTQDGNVGASGDGSSNSYEFSHPLCSEDAAHDFCVSVGDTLGFLIRYFDRTINASDSWPAPFTSPNNDASGWADFTIAAHTVLVLGSMRGLVGGWAFAAVEDDSHSVVHSVPGDILLFDRVDTPDLVHLAMAAPTCSFPGRCVVETRNPDVTYTLSSDDTFTLTFELVSTRFVLEIPSTPFTLAVSCTVNLSSRTDRCVFSRTPDLNNDRIVNILDLVRIGSAFGSRTGALNYDPAVDLNADGVVNILDLAIVASSFGTPVFK